MKVVPKYTLMLGTTVTAILSIIAFIGIEVTRSQIEHDMRQDHRVVGRMLQASISAIWQDVGRDETKQARAGHETFALLDQSNKEREPTTFAWTTDKARSRRGAGGARERHRSVGGVISASCRASRHSQDLAFVLDLFFSM